MHESLTGILPIASLAAMGLAGAFLLALAERLVPVVPSYGLFIFLGSALVEKPLDLLPLIVVTTLGSALGGICWYGIGYALGEERTHAMVRRFGRYICLRETTYLSLAGRYERNAFLATFVGQTIPVVRCYLGLPAGILSLPLGRFSLAVLAGSALWIGSFVSLGYGLHILGWNPLVATLGAVAALIAIEGAVAWLVQRRRKAA